MSRTSIYGRTRAKKEPKYAQNGVQNTKLPIIKPNGILKLLKFIVGSNTGLLPKQVSQKHIFDHSWAIMTYKGFKMAD